MYSTFWYKELWITINLLEDPREIFYWWDVIGDGNILMEDQAKESWWNIRGMENLVMEGQGKKQETGTWRDGKLIERLNDGTLGAKKYADKSPRTRKYAYGSLGATVSWRKNGDGDKIFRNWVCGWRMCGGCIAYVAVRRMWLGDVFRVEYVRRCGWWMFGCLACVAVRRVGLYGVLGCTRFVALGCVVRSCVAVQRVWLYGMCGCMSCVVVRRVWVVSDVW